MSLEHKHIKIGQGKLLRHALPVILPYIQAELSDMLDKIAGDFGNGETTFITHAARITTLINMKDQLLAEDAVFEKLEKEVYGSNQR